VVVVVEGLAVAQHRVHLPGRPVRYALDPELVLPGIAAGRVPLVGRVQAGPGQTGLHGVDRVGVGDLDAQMIEAAALARVLQQDQLQRWLGDSEVRVTGADLGRAGAEQLAVEGDGLLDVVHVEGELQARHANLLIWASGRL
jgi:hypothetical protein